MLHDFLAKGFPVVAVGARIDAPEVELKLALGERRAWERFIVSINLSDFHRGLHGSVVDCLENQLVHLVCAIRLERQTHNLESVCEALNANANRSMAHVRGLSLHNRVEVAVDHLVEVLGDTFSDPVEGLVIELFRRGAGKLRK